jgi:Xaa-Pro aminopeptidase
MRQAANIAVEAHCEAMRRVRPGMLEYEVQALLDAAFVRRGAAGPGYETIVGGGENATVLHYIQNDQPLRDGTLLLVDAGAEYQFYNSDITRTFPVGPRFSPAQRDVYQAVLAVQKEAIAQIRPGQSAHALTQWSKRALAQAMLDLGLLSGQLETLVEEKKHERFYMHGLGHYLGMDVHDVGAYLRDESTPIPLEAGVVLTVEPGLYIPADAEDLRPELRGIGIRIEDDVLVTTDGAEVLTPGAPKEIGDIEALRREAF